MPDEIVDSAYRFLRSHLRGKFRFEEHFEPMRIVVAPDGRLIAPVMVAMLRSFDTVLFLPDDAPESLHLQVTLAEFQEHGPDGVSADRWRVYHGEPPDLRWAYFALDAARFDEHFLDGEGLSRINILAEHEPRLCRLMNADLDRLRAVTAAHLPKRIEDPRIVGVDPLGLDVRGAFEVYRLDFDTPLESADDAEAAWEALVRGVGSR